MQSDASSSLGSRTRPLASRARARRLLPAVFALATGVGVLGVADRAEALPLLTLSGSLRGLYGSPVGDAEPSAYGPGIGLRGGLTIPSSLYLGASLDYFFGESLEAGGSEISTSLLQVMGHLGYDLGLGPLTLRPGLGLGLSSFSVEISGPIDGDESESKFVASPGVEGMISLGLLSVGAEVRYNKVFADGDVDAVVLGVGLGFSL